MKNRLIRGEVPGAVAAGLGNALPGSLHQLIQMTGTGMAVAEGAFDEDLGLAQILHLPAGTDTEGILLGSDLTHLLTD